MPVHLNIPIVEASNYLNLDEETTALYLSTLNIQGPLITYKEACLEGFFPLEINLIGSLSQHKLLDLNTLDLGIEFYLLIQGSAFKEVSINGDIDLSMGLCMTGSLEMEDYRTKNIDPNIDILYPHLEMKLKELIDLPKDYITYDLRILIDNHTEVIPEIGYIIHFSNCTLQNFRNQDKVRIEVTDTKELYSYGPTHDRRNIWLSAIVYFEDIPTLWLLNEYWDRVIDHPLRFVLNLPSFSRMIQYLRSLIVLDPEEEGVINILRTDPMQSYAKTTSYPIGNLKIFNNPMKESDVQYLYEIVTRFVTLHKQYNP